MKGRVDDLILRYRGVPLISNNLSLTYGEVVFLPFFFLNLVFLMELKVAFLLPYQHSVCCS